MYLTKRFKIFPAYDGNAFLCNALTGEIMIISESGLDVLEALQLDASIDVPNSKKILTQKSMMFSSQEDEDMFFEQMCQKSWDDYLKRAPSHYTFIMNTQCNYNCPYCFEPESSRKINATIQLEQIDAAFRIIDRRNAENPDHDKPGIEIFGGEPLLLHSKPNLDYLFGMIARRSYSASIQTNGYYLIENLDIIKRYCDQIDLIQITIDGPEDVHNRRRVLYDGTGTFEKIVWGIDAFLKENLPIRLNLRTNVDMENISCLEDLAAFYDEKGWTQDSRVGFIAAPVDNRCGNLAHTSKLLSWLAFFERIFPISTDKGGIFDVSVFKTLGYFRSYLYSARHNLPVNQEFIPKVHYCEAAALKLLIFHPDGHVYPCPEAVGMDDLAMGRYYPDEYNDPEKQSMWFGQNILRRDQCRTCEISTFCGGGCILTALMQNGTMEKPVCEDAPEIVASYFQKIVGMM